MATILDLPSELLVYIFNNLNYIDIVNISCVSKFLREIVYGNRWNCFCVVHNSQFFQKPISFNLIHFDYMIQINDFIKLESIKNVTTISFRCLDLDDGYDGTIVSITDTIFTHLVDIGCKNIVINMFFGNTIKLLSSKFNYYFSNQGFFKLSYCYQRFKQLTVEMYTIEQHIKMFGDIAVYDRLYYDYTEECMITLEKYFFCPLFLHDVSSLFEPICNVENRTTEKKKKIKTKREKLRSKYPRKISNAKLPYVPKYFYSR